MIWRMHSGGGKPRAHGYRTAISTYSLCGNAKAKEGTRVDPDGTMELCGKCLKLPSGQKSLAKMVAGAEKADDADSFD